MKRLIALLTALALTLCAPAALAEAYSFSGSLAPRTTLTIVAPFGGTVLACEPKAGDLVPAGEALATLEATRVYAPCDGTVKGLFAAEGDALADVAKLYAAPMTVEPSSTLVISATTSAAYNSLETKYVHVGERVYAFSDASKDRKGAGVVTAVSGTGFTVEITASDELRINENCYISRENDRDETKQRIGGGRTRRNDPVPVTASGSVLRLYVAEGDAVRKGDLLMETVQGDLRGKAVAGTTVSAEKDVVILSGTVSAGASVQQNQPLYTAYEAGTLEAVALVDESDLHAVAVGQSAKVELDGAPDAPALRGTVRAISYVPASGATGVSYEVRVAFENDAFVRQGMSVTVVMEE